MANNFVTVATFANSFTANLAQQRLQAEGIKCYLADEATANLVWDLTVAIGWIKLKVAQSDIEQAKFILGSAEFDYQSDEPPEELYQDNDEIEIVSWADQTADRAFRTAIVGLIVVFLPLPLYSLWLLTRLLISRQPISPKSRIKVIVAAIICLLYILIIWQIFF
jgi:hypothetical protein